MHFRTWPEISKQLTKKKNTFFSFVFLEDLLLGLLELWGGAGAAGCLELSMHRFRNNFWRWLSLAKSSLNGTKICQMNIR